MRDPGAGSPALPGVIPWLLLFSAFYVGMHLLAVASSRYRFPWMPIPVILGSLWLARPTLPEGRVRQTAVGLTLVGFLALASHYVVNVLP